MGLQGLDLEPVEHAGMQATHEAELKLFRQLDRLLVELPEQLQLRLVGRLHTRVLNRFEIESLESHASAPVAQAERRPGAGAPGIFVGPIRCRAVILRIDRRQSCRM